jgi:hypothetical protein
MKMMGSAGDTVGAEVRMPLLESLYHDQIPPTATNLKCRWQEIVAEFEKIHGKVLFKKKINVQDLLRMYGGQPSTLVIVDQGVDGSVINNLDSKRAAILKEMAARPGKPVSPGIARQEVAPNMKLRGEPEIFLVGFRIVPEWFQGFMDPLGPDVYPEEMWTALAVYLHHQISEVGENGWFQGGRYGAAKELRRLDLPFLRGRSLGELSHIVQLALTNEQGGGRGLLSYQPDKTIAPRSLSQRHCLADLGLPAGDGLLRRVGQGCTTDEERWAELRHVLRVVLSYHPEGRSLALLKIDIERQFGMILDQSVFREVKLSHVFESQELMDHFAIRREVQSGAVQFIVHLKDSLSLAPPPGLELPEDPNSVPLPSLHPMEKGMSEGQCLMPPSVVPSSRNVRNEAPTLLQAARPAEQFKFGAHDHEEKENLLGLQNQAPMQVVPSGAYPAIACNESNNSWSTMESGCAGGSAIRHALRAKGARIHRALQTQAQGAQRDGVGADGHNDPRFEPAKIDLTPSLQTVVDMRSELPLGFAVAKGFSSSPTDDALGCQKKHVREETEEYISAIRQQQSRRGLQRQLGLAELGLPQYLLRD